MRKKYIDIHQLLAKIGQRGSRVFKICFKNDVVPQTFKVGEEGVMNGVMQLNAEVYFDENNAPLRLG